MDIENHPELAAWSRLIGTWSIDGSHPLLPGAEIRGTAVFEWLADQQLLLMRAHYDHPDIPDALTVTSVVDDQPVINYFDPRGMHRTFDVAMTEAEWRYWNDDPSFAQRFTGTFSDDGSTITGVGERREDGEWILDIELTYRRAA